LPDSTSTPAPSRRSRAAPGSHSITGIG